MGVVIMARMREEKYEKEKRRKGNKILWFTEKEEVKLELLFSWV